MTSIIDQHLAAAAAAHKAGNFSDAEEAYSRLLNTDPDNPHLLYLLGDVVLQTGRAAVGRLLTRRALDLAPAEPNAWLNLGVAEKLLHRRDAALKAWNECLRLDPRSARAMTNIGSLYADGIDPEHALSVLARALEIDPGDINAAWMLSLANLSLGRWADGWGGYDMRKRLDSWTPRAYAPDWDGSPGKRVIVHGEQGVGDEVMFASCIDDLRERAELVAIECEPRLIPLFARRWGVPCLPTPQAVAASGIRADAQVALGSLPVLFRRDGAFPGNQYLAADPARIAAARAWLQAQGPGPYVGLSWVGGTTKTRGHDRAIRPDLLADLPGTKVSLQYGPLAADAGRLEFATWAPFSDGSDLDSQAALIAALDVVVSVTTTVVHLAGALGRPCHVLVQRHPTWRYCGPEMPWYRSVTLHRQTVAGDWSAPLESVRRALVDQRILQAA